MEENLLRMLVPGIGLISGLIATYVSLQNRALLAEVRRELAELENRIFEKINGKFVRAGECHLREANLQARLEMLADDIRNSKAAGA